MANVSSIAGAVPKRSLIGGAGVNRTGEYLIASATAHNIFTGDFVKMLDTGYIDVATAGDTILGVFAGCSFLDNSGVPGGRWSPYWPTGTATTGSVAAVAYIIDDPWAIFEIETDATNAFALTNVGNNADFVAGAGNSTTGNSGFTLDLSSPGSGAANLRIVRLSPVPGNAFGVSAKVEVLINEHFYKTTTGI